MPFSDIVLKIDYVHNRLYIVREFVKDVLKKAFESLIMMTSKVFDNNSHDGSWIITYFSDYPVCILL